MTTTQALTAQLGGRGANLAPWCAPDYRCSPAFVDRHLAVRPSCRRPLMSLADRMVRRAQTSLPVPFRTLAG